MLDVHEVRDVERLLARELAHDPLQVFHVLAVGHRQPVLVRHVALAQHVDQHVYRDVLSATADQHALAADRAHLPLHVVLSRRASNSSSPSFGRAWHAGLSHSGSSRSLSRADHLQMAQQVRRPQMERPSRAPAAAKCHPFSCSCLKRAADGTARTHSASD
jgi:hypothetical protein